MTETVADPAVAPDRPSPSGPDYAQVARAILLGPFRARTWKQFAFVLIAAPLAIVAIPYLAGGFGVSIGLSITVVGVPLLALVILSGRVWALVYRALCRTLLDTPIPPPAPFDRGRGFFGFLGAAFADRTSWRALAFVLAEIVLGLGLGYPVLIAITVTVFTAISPIPWALFHPTNVDSQGRSHHSLAQFGNYYVETWPRVLALAAIGVLGCLVLPWLLRGVCWLHSALAQALLAPTARDRRMAELREGRRVAVEDSAATLRRLERDLHDGTQARLVTIAMTLGRAQERIADGTDPADLIADARDSSKEALAELRELVRGIHPPALELGLEPALETLAARCAVPVELRVHLPHRPTPAIEAIAYFSVAELLTNVVKHSGATQAWVSALPAYEGTIALVVRDDGHGGALPPSVPTGETVVSGGLSGLAARARSVDGALTVDSPAGGPTVVTLTLPIAGPQ
ncbi:sensor domain-containing protein [Nocardia sp. NEAU-G5]|uniref:histidine kinase n=1 Tax=Nocardia albiluteola TaxID=2842303 RepID=A0ABS6B9Q7_9NOCA|nr:sensor domain-containing protein [Nocardia albiluteola]MBU3066130.1 sensor domain-containing protein [Nocardia albiluteola]